jgi:hypothetical protein
MKIVFWLLASDVFKKYYNLWPVELRTIVFSISSVFRPQMDRKRGKWWVELVGLNSAIYLESHWASVYQRQRHESPKNHARVFSLHSTRGWALVDCLAFFPWGIDENIKWTRLWLLLFQVLLYTWTDRFWNAHCSEHGTSGAVWWYVMVLQDSFSS